MTTPVNPPAQSQPDEVDKSLNLDTLPENVKEMITFLRLNSSFDTSSAQVDILSRILDGSNMEEVYAAANAGTESGQSFAGRPFLLKLEEDIDWKRSAPGFIRQGAFPFYALIKVTDLADGSEHLLDCGGFSFVGVLYKLVRTDEFSKFPGGIPLVITAKQMQGSGFSVLLLLPYAGPLYKRPTTVKSSAA